MRAVDALVGIAVAALATWRIAAWLWYEHGAEPVRCWLCRTPWLSGQVSCFWCVSFWVSLPVMLAWWLWWPALLPFALSGAVILLSGGGRVIWREVIADE
jgi:hypothetical protein